MHEVTARVEIPTRTILKVLLVLATLWFFARIGPVLYQLFAGILLAMTFHPPIARLQRWGFSKGGAIATVFGTFVGGLALVLWFLVPQWIDEGQDFWDDLPGYIDDGTDWLQAHAPWLVDRLVEWAERQSDDGQGIAEADDAAADSGTEADVSTDAMEITSAEVTEEVRAEEDVFRSAISAGQGVAGFIANAFVAIVLAIYFLVDGDRAFGWLARDLRPGTVRRLRRATSAMSVVVNEYVSKQLLTCAICGVYTYVVLAALGVPSPFILATIAAVTDAIPLIGVVMATIPAVVIALTQGWEIALLVLIAYVAYQAFENFVLVPRIFGRTLQLSSFGMLMAVLVGWKLAGLPGILLALPIAAALLVIERVWLDEDQGSPIPEAAAPGPGAVVGAAVDAAADATGDDTADFPDRAEDATDRNAEPDPAEPVSTPAELPPPAVPPGTVPESESPPAATGKARRGGRLGGAGQVAPEVTSG